LGLSTAVPADLTRIDEAITLAGQMATMWEGRTWWWARKRRKFKTWTRSIVTTADSGVSRASNVVTLTTTAAHGLAIGQEIYVSGVDAAGFDGVFVILTVPSTTTLTYAQEGDDETSEEGTVYVASYPLRTANSSAMTDLGSVLRVWIDTHPPLSRMTYDDYNDWVVMQRSTGQPLSYCVTRPGPISSATAVSISPQIYFAPIAGTIYTVTVEYMQRHSKIVNATAAEAALIVPPEFHYPVYCLGAAWLLRHDTTDVAALEECPEFAAAMRRMAASEGDMDYGIEEPQYLDPTYREWNIRSGGTVSL